MESVNAEPDDLPSVEGAKAQQLRDLKGNFARIAHEVREVRAKERHRLDTARRSMICVTGRSGQRWTMGRPRAGTPKPKSEPNTCEAVSAVSGCALREQPLVSGSEMSARPFKAMSETARNVKG